MIVVVDGYGSNNHEWRQLWPWLQRRLSIIAGYYDVQWLQLRRVPTGQHTMLDNVGGSNGDNNGANSWWPCTLSNIKKEKKSSSLFLLYALGFIPFLSLCRGREGKNPSYIKNMGTKKELIKKHQETPKRARTRGNPKR